MLDLLGCRRCTDQLVGRAAELGMRGRGARPSSSGDRSGALELVGEPGIGKTRLLAELERPCRPPRAGIVLAGSASELESELPFWVFVDALDEYVQGARAAPPRRARRTRRAPSSRTSCRRSPLAARTPPAEQRDDRYRAHRAVGRLLEALAAAEAAGAAARRPALGGLRARSSCSAALLRRPPSAPVLIALALRPAPAAGAAASRARARPPRRHADAPGARRAEPRRRRASCSARASTAEATALYERERRQPVLPRAARARAAAPARAAAGDGVSMAGVEVPRAVAAALTEELALLSRCDAPRARGRRRGGRPVRARAGRRRRAACPRPAAIDALDELLRRRPRAHHRRAAPLPLPPPAGAAAPSTRPRRAAGGSARTSGPREALAARGAPAVERAHHVESLRAATATWPRSRCCARRARRPSRATPATAARLFAGRAAAAARDRAGGRTGRAARRALAGAQVAAGRFCEARAAMLESARAAPSSRRRRRGSALIAALRRDREPARPPQGGPRTGSTTALEELPDPSSPEAAALMIELAIDGFYRLDYDSMQRLRSSARSSVAAATGSTVAARYRGLGRCIARSRAAFAGNVPTRRGGLRRGRGSRSTS